MRDQPKFADLIGKTLTGVSGEVDGDEVVFQCDDGSTFKLHHSQDCCESVSIESITGDLADLIGVPILRAEEVTSDTTPADFKHDYEPESQTWTFYKLATVKGWVDIRWFGQSDGYYSESVDFVRV
jgi:hypothetical protein